MKSLLGALIDILAMAIFVLFVVILALSFQPTMPVVDRNLTTLEAFKGGDKAQNSGAGYGVAPLITPIDY